MENGGSCDQSTAGLFCDGRDWARVGGSHDGCGSGTGFQLCSDAGWDLVLRVRYWRDFLDAVVAAYA